MGRDFKYYICDESEQISFNDLYDKGVYWKYDLYLRNNNYLPHEHIYNKDGLFDFIWNIEIDNDYIDEYDKAITVLLDIHHQMSKNHIVYLRNS